MDVQIVSIAAGLILSLLFSEAFGLAAGGMIVPGYFALYLNQPGCIVVTLLAALLTYGITKCVTRATLIYGRRRIAIMLIVGFLVGSLLRSAGAWLQPSLTLENGHEARVLVGFILPGLIALWIDRQGLVETLAPVVTLSVMVRLVLVVLGWELVS